MICGDQDACCGEYWDCKDCKEAGGLLKLLQVWGRGSGNARAVLCGVLRV